MDQEWVPGRAAGQACRGAYAEIERGRAEQAEAEIEYLRGAIDQAEGQASLLASIHKRWPRMVSLRDTPSVFRLGWMFMAALPADLAFPDFWADRLLNQRA